MHRINDLFGKVTEELWAIKRYDSKVELKDLVDLYRAYSLNFNLVIDAINAQAIAHEGSGMPFPDDDVACIVAAFRECNGQGYDRLLVETLILLDRDLAWRYLKEILSVDENREKFKLDFKRSPDWLKTLEALGESESGV